MFTSFHILPFGLRPEAVISKPAVFASLSRVLSNPLRGFSSTFISLETKSEALRLRFSFQRRERDSNPRSCDRLRISRPAQSTTLASLRGSHNVVKYFSAVYEKRTNLWLILFCDYPQAVSNRCCGNENPEAWATRR